AACWAAPCVRGSRRPGRRSGSRTSPPESSARGRGRRASRSADRDVVVAVVVEGERAAGSEDDDGEWLFDERGPLELDPGSETSAVVDRRLDELVAEVHGPCGLARLLGVADVPCLGHATGLGREALGD